MKIAILGASKDKFKYGNIILRDLIKKGYSVYPVNPNENEIENIKVFNSIEELPEDTEVAVLVLPPLIGLKEIKKAVDKKIKKFYLQPGTVSKDITDYLDKHPEVKYKKGCVMVDTSLRNRIEF